MTDIPILDGILAFIESYKLGIAMVGVAVVGLRLLTRAVAPDWSRDHKPALISMIVSGIVLTMISDITSLIIG